jgi:hypothetical protein
MKKTFKKGDTLYTQLIKRNPKRNSLFFIEIYKTIMKYIAVAYHYSIIMDSKLDEKTHILFVCHSAIWIWDFTLFILYAVKFGVTGII